MRNLAYYVCWVSGTIGIVTAIAGFSLDIGPSHRLAWPFGIVAGLSGLSLAAAGFVILGLPLFRRNDREQ